ncbi:hypothetical protein AA313_de0209877 [Arthrobotrys entomopaga]|nr:hypothetical protein AA313_de0209877 [Arthrobotrys entomopaga]
MYHEECDCMHHCYCCSAFFPLSHSFWPGRATGSSIPHQSIITALLFLILPFPNCALFILFFTFWTFFLDLCLSLWFLRGVYIRLCTQGASERGSENMRRSITTRPPWAPASPFFPPFPFILIILFVAYFC